ncbi:hypothetical protein MJI95_39585, partial [Salmonella enterica subsp. enterica serovar Kentucky]|nr:hypothetical protein [Salmonella enterica subsp. enterica serovar Kentucky]
LLYLIQPLIWIRLWVRGRKAPAYRKRWGERYGFYRRPLKPGGKVMVVERRNFQRVYDLTPRVMPHWDDERDGLSQSQAENLML